MTTEDRSTGSEKAKSTTKKAAPDKPLSAKIGRGLGSLVKRASKTDVWNKTRQAYQEGLEGKNPTKE